MIGEDVTTVNQFLWKLPDWYQIKQVHESYSSFVSGNKTCVKLLGFDKLDEFLYKKDLDIKTNAAKYASKYHLEDKQVVDNQKSLSILYNIDYSDGVSRLLYIKKSPLKLTERNEDQIFCQGYFLNDNHLIQLFRNIIKFDKQYISRHQGCYYFTEDLVDPLKLTKQQHACLFHLLRGKTAKEIANLLSLSKRTVEFYLNNLKIKFNCLNRNQLIEKAIEMGYLYYLPTVCTPHIAEE